MTTRKTFIRSVLLMLIAVAGGQPLGASHGSPGPNPQAIVGTWEVNVPTSDQGFPPFAALHTFGADGTFVETSSNFATLTEGPAHGAWNVRHGRVNLTFELFVFDSGQATGIVRVRCELKLVTPNRFTAKYAVDFIDFDGNTTLGIDTGTFSGERLRVVPL